MNDKPYSRMSPEELVLRDRLAADRTALANERTLLAYIRTALAFFVTGVAFLHFLESHLLRSVGWLFVATGIAALVVGLIRYMNVRAMVKRIRTLEPPSQTH